MDARKCSIGEVTVSGPVGGGGEARGAVAGMAMGTGTAIGWGMAWRGMEVDAAGAGVGPLGAGPSAMTTHNTVSSNHYHCEMRTYRSAASPGQGVCTRGVGRQVEAWPETEQQAELHV